MCSAMLAFPDKTVKDDYHTSEHLKHVIERRLLSRSVKLAVRLHYQ
jgi:hypothetical protein